MPTIIATIAAFTYIILCGVALWKTRNAPNERNERETTDMHHQHHQHHQHHHHCHEFLLVIEGTSPVGEVNFRTSPLPLGVAMGAAARMVDSPTPARIVPATPANLDRWPEMLDSERVVVWLYQNKPLPTRRGMYARSQHQCNN